MSYESEKQDLLDWDLEQTRLIKNKYANEPKGRDGLATDARKKHHIEFNKRFMELKNKYNKL